MQVISVFAGTPFWYCPMFSVLLFYSHLHILYLFFWIPCPFPDKWYFCWGWSLTSTSFEKWTLTYGVAFMLPPISMRLWTCMVSLTLILLVYLLVIFFMLYFLDVYCAFSKMLVWRCLQKSIKHSACKGTWQWSPNGPECVVRIRLADILLAQAWSQKNMLSYVSHSHHLTSDDFSVC